MGYPCHVISIFGTPTRMQDKKRFYVLVPCICCPECIRRLSSHIKIYTLRPDDEQNHLMLYIRDYFSTFNILIVFQVDNACHSCTGVSRECIDPATIVGFPDPLISLIAARVYRTRTRRKIQTSILSAGL